MWEHGYRSEASSETPPDCRGGGDQYFVDTTTVDVGATTVEHLKILLGTVTHLSHSNALLVGEPGTGKITFANVIASAITGLPFDLFVRTQIQGYPDQTKEQMLARAHIGELTTEGAKRRSNSV